MSGYISTAHSAVNEFIHEANAYKNERVAYLNNLDEVPMAAIRIPKPSNSAAKDFLLKVIAAIKDESAGDIEDCEVIAADVIAGGTRIDLYVDWRDVDGESGNSVYSVYSLVVY